MKDKIEKLLDKHIKLHSVRAFNQCVYDVDFTALRKGIYSLLPHFAGKINNMTDFNLPPGCNVSDIPGNRPEDEKAEAIFNTFYSGLNDEQRKACDDADPEVMNVISLAIDYGVIISADEARANERERIYYEEYQEVNNKEGSK